MSKYIPILFAIGTALCWGLYGPTLGKARNPERLYSPFKPYVGIGAAYIVWAFIGGIIVMKLLGDDFTLAGPHRRAGVWGFAAGTLGALGALSLTWAMMKGGAAMPHVVMSVVFGGAVTIAALVSVYQNPEHSRPMMWVGILITAVGAITVAVNTPHAHPPSKGGEQAAQGEHAETPAESPD